MILGQLMAYPNSWCGGCVFSEIQVLNRFPANVLATFLKGCKWVSISY